MFLYLHGFLSSPASEKAQLTQRYVKQHHPHIDLLVPQLPNTPEQALALVEAIAAQAEGELRLVGSSMGGFLATLLLDRFAGKAVLINPAVTPHRLMRDYLGEHQNPYTQERFWLDERHILALQQMAVQQPSSRIWALLQSGDETLDYRDAQQFYRNAKVTVEQGGDHSFVGYAERLPAIFDFLLSD